MGRRRAPPDARAPPTELLLSTAAPGPGRPNRGKTSCTALGTPRERRPAL